ncbi:hypothetical protein HCN51_02550 [Nonomuraea sp. FMUSA5-5]|uniref:Uncharacterized protein n=1 Tax=Nonomuraea composti TaxID=2720023 RepID=A0ABX1AWF7_9ACTN|nr:hypothetical protein [Nonomuraea sp. FMUSA5-5]NJP88349.1 hypothetical protein [Nonomuraea sp. FMUSA5-5]
MSVQDLRDVLRERAEGPAPANPHRHDQVHARVRRVRRRRRAAAGAAALAAVVVAALLVPGQDGPLPAPGLLPGRDGLVPGEVPPAAQPAAGLPERFVTRDGTEYRRIGLATLTEARASVTVPVSGNPLEVATPCDGVFSSMPEVFVDSRRVNGREDSCGDSGLHLLPLDVPQGAADVTLTFAERGCDAPAGACGPERGAREVAVYEWTPPAMTIEPPRVKALPRRLDGGRLADSASGRWPGAATVTLSGRGATTLDVVCSGDLAPRMWFEVRVNGRLSRTQQGCPVWTDGPFPKAGLDLGTKQGERVTVTVRTGMWGAGTNRPVRWSIGLYVK